MNLKFTLPIQTQSFTPVSHLPVQAERWLNVDQMADLHGFSVSKIRAMCRKKIIPAIKVGLTWICSESDWNRYSRSMKPSRISTRERKSRTRALN
jgi:hypothetical protein